MRRPGFFLLLGLLVPGTDCGKLAAQLRPSLSVTAGYALERYTGDFSVVTVPLVDSTEFAIAGVSEWGFAGRLGVFNRPNRTLEFAAEGDLRQSVAAGFRQRNYAPREHNLLLEANYEELLAGGALRFTPRIGTRTLADLAPMPLFITPGYLSYAGEVEFAKPMGSRYGIDVGVVAEEKDYAGPSVLRDLDLLDRQSVEVQAGVSSLFRSSSGTDEPSGVRFLAAYLTNRYPRQGHRRDHALRVGGEWELDFSGSRGLQVFLNVNGTLNRSNSSRVEYNSLRVNAVAYKTIGDYLVHFSGEWAGKSYVSPQEFLVPGEEADNAIIVFGEVTRFLSSNVEAIVGGGWTRAETNISGDYYEQARMSFSLLWRPRF